MPKKGELKTHCPQGHEYAGDNLVIYASGRQCRTCITDRNNKRNEARRAARQKDGNSAGRGSGNRRKTHCPQGHAYEGDNLSVYKGVRYCRACNHPKSKRGILNGKKTHCPQGHPYEGDNLYVRRGMRRCRACRVAHNRRYYLAEKALLSSGEE